MSEVFVPISFILVLLKKHVYQNWTVFSHNLGVQHNNWSFAIGNQYAGLSLLNLTTLQSIHFCAVRLTTGSPLKFVHMSTFIWETTCWLLLLFCLLLFFPPYSGYCNTFFRLVHFYSFTVSIFLCSMFFAICSSYFMWEMLQLVKQSEMSNVDIIIQLPFVLNFCYSVRNALFQCHFGTD